MKIGEPTTEQILYWVIILSDNYQLPFCVALFTILPLATRLTKQSNAVWGYDKQKVSEKIKTLHLYPSFGSLEKLKVTANSPHTSIHNVTFGVMPLKY